MRNDYNSIAEILSSVPENYKILEETIDLDIQKDFFESSNELQINIESLPVLINELKTNSSVAEKKIILQKLAMLDSVEAFRAIETYNLNPDQELKDWAILALQQSRMVLQSSLLDEQQIFISTGLGGKTNKLRYFLIFPYFSKTGINEIQKNALKNELNFFLKKYEGEVEETNFEMNQYATALALIPLKAEVSDLIKELLAECNQLGNFLSDDVIITNIKIFNHEEIIDILNKYEETN